jgi:hypothetical protein
MMIDKDTETKILRYHFVEKWRVGTVASQLRYSSFGGGSGAVAGRVYRR